MKIHFLVSSLGPGGAERVATTLCNAWAERGDHVTLVPTFSERGECFYELSPNINLLYLADLVSSRKRSLGNQLARLEALRKFISAERPDVIVSFLSNVNVAVILASAGLGIPTVVCERTDPFIFPASLWLRLARRLTYPFADAVVVQTQAVASKYQSGKWYLRQLNVMANPISQSILDMQHRANEKGGRRLLAIGRFDQGKQFDMLINLFACLAIQHKNWFLRIVGDGTMRPVLQQQISDLGLDGRVELPGRTDAIGEELVKADVFVLTSKFEGFPNVLLEAMAVGLPCVAFDCPSGPREISLDGQVALLVPLNDSQAMRRALERLMLNDELRLSLGSRARTSVIERFTLDNILGQWDMLFKTIGTL